MVQLWRGSFGLGKPPCGDRKRGGGSMDKRELVRRHYADVLLGLCKDHRLRDLTVADVVEAAGTARQTFYNYFSDLNDLICFTAFLPMTDASDPFTDPNSTRRTHEVTMERRAFYCQLPQHMGQNNFWEALGDWLRKTYYCLLYTSRCV